ncbi:MAG: ribosome maturation factor RimM [Clostridia bacterium]|jgi:16S rRNA processing protein RimM|nr:ribosome maturation factor RimM [Clostridia bacterium]
MGYFTIGKITGTHGIKGTFRVFPTTEDPKRFELLKELTFDLNGKKDVFTIQKVAYQKNMILLTVNEIDDINIAEKYKGAKIEIPDEKALPLDENEYYIRDLYDMDVYTTNGEYLGKICDIYFSAANDVYCVKDSEHPEKKEILIPAVKKMIKEINVKDKKMTVELYEGLR